MNLIVNGRELPLKDGTSVTALVELLGLREKRVAVEINKELVIKKEWDARILREGDRVEVVTFVGGG